MKKNKSTRKCQIEGELQVLENEPHCYIFSNYIYCITMYNYWYESITFFFNSVVYKVGKIKIVILKSHKMNNE